MKRKTFEWALVVAAALALGACGGSDGEDGEDANPLTARTSEVAAGADCESGGVLVEFGIDIDENGELSDEEVENSTVLCNGQDGADGQDGAEGETGPAGTNSLVNVTDEPAGENCPAGGYLVETGLDNGDGGETADDGMLGTGEVDASNYICNGVDGFPVLTTLTDVTSCPNGTRLDIGLDNGDDGETARDGTLGTGEIDQTTVICDGADGTNGSNGVASLADVTAEPAGTNCADGGQRIDTGLDNGDGGGTAGDGTLDAGEIDNTSYVCNGADGTDGQNGTDGATSLVVTTVEPAGTNCADGGQRIDSGLDNGDGGETADDGTLGAGEVDDTSYVCNGAPGPQGPEGPRGATGPQGPAGSNGFATLVTQTSINGQGSCSDAGVRIDSGLDNGDGAGTARDNSLHPDEVDQTSYVCDGGGSSMTVVDANGALLGDVLDINPEHVFVRTAAGYLVTIGWDGTPQSDGNAQNYAQANCTVPNAVDGFNDDVALRAGTLYWNPRDGVYMSASDGSAQVVVKQAVISNSYWNYNNSSCTPESAGTYDAWPASPLSPSQVGLPSNIVGPIQVQ